jgi:GNAT superfamily N-acetyltransferase
MTDVEIIKGYVPGSIGKVTQLHGTYYHQHWNFSLFFEARVATELAEFLGRYDQHRDGFWIAMQGGRMEGSIAIDGLNAEDTGVHLRWFIMSEVLRGKCIGRQLIDTAIGFCHSKDYKRVYLCTFEGLNAARHLYEKVGFRLVEQQKGSQWGTEVNEQRFELQLG